MYKDFLAAIEAATQEVIAMENQLDAEDFGRKSSSRAIRRKAEVAHQRHRKELIDKVCCNDIHGFHKTATSTMSAGQLGALKSGMTRHGLFSWNSKDGAAAPKRYRKSINAAENELFQLELEAAEARRTEANAAADAVIGELIEARNLADSIIRYRQAITSAEAAEKEASEKLIQILKKLNAFNPETLADADKGYQTGYKYYRDSMLESLMAVNR